MGYAYTPGLTVAERTVVRKVRRLPLKGDVLVRIGQHVKAEDVVAQTFLPGKPEMINVVAKLGAATAATGFDVVLYRCAKMDDGRFNNNGWLQELPDPVTKVTWDNVLLMSPKTAKELGVAGFPNGKNNTSDNAHAHDGQFKQFVVQVTVGKRSVQAPVWIQPGMADNTVALALGYGRTRTGRVGSEVGANAYSLLTSKNPTGSAHLATGGKLDRVPSRHLVAVTQEHGLMEGRPVIREANLEQAHGRLTGETAILLLFLRNSDLGRAVGQAHAERFDRRGHRVGGVHATAGAGTGDGAGLELMQAGIIHLAGRVLADLIAGRDPGLDLSPFAFERFIAGATAAERHFV